MSNELYYLNPTLNEGYNNLYKRCKTQKKVISHLYAIARQVMTDGEIEASLLRGGIPKENLRWEK